MPAIQCPNCHTALNYNPEFAGRAAVCPHCQARFKMPAAQSEAAEEPWTPPVQKVVPRRKGLIKAGAASFWYVFDWKFQRYFTPWIIRTNWILAVFAALLYIGLEGISRLVAVVGGATATRSSEPEATDLVGLIQQFQNVHSQSGIQKVIGDIQGLVIVVTGALFFLLSVRVGCEAFMVLFNIAESAAKIEKALAERPPE